jgi:hypothetical protein
MAEESEVDSTVNTGTEESSSTTSIPVKNPYDKVKSIAQKLENVVQTQNLVVHQTQRHTISSNFEPIEKNTNEDPYLEREFDRDGLNFKPKILEAIDGYTYDDLAEPSRFTPAEQTFAKQAQESVDTLLDYFFNQSEHPTDDSDEESGDSGPDESVNLFPSKAKTKNYNLIDIDKILPVSYHGFSSYHTRRCSFDTGFKSYTSAYLFLYEMLFMEDPLMATLMSNAVYVRPRNSSYKDANLQLPSSALTWEDIEKATQTFLTSHKSKFMNTKLYSERLSKHVKNNSVVDLFVIKHEMDDVYTEELDKSISEMRLNISKYVNNIRRFLVHHTLSSANQRALLFEKDLGVRPFYYLGDFTQNASTRGKNIPYIVPDPPPAYDKKDYKTITFTAKSQTTNIRKVVNSTKPIGVTNRLWSSFVSDGYVHPDPVVIPALYTTQGSTDRSEFLDLRQTFLHMFQFRVDKVYGYCPSLSESSYSLVYDSTVNNAATLEIYLSKFYQFCVSMSSQVPETTSKKKTLSVKFWFVMQPSVCLSDLALYMCSKKKSDTVDDYTVSSYDVASHYLWKPISNEVALAMPKFYQIPLDKVAHYVTHLTSPNSGKELDDQSLFMSVTMTDLKTMARTARGIGPYEHILKRMYKENVDIPSTDMNKHDMPSEFLDQNKDVDPESLQALYWFIQLYSSASLMRIYEKISETLALMQIPEFPIETDIVSLPPIANIIKTPLSHKIGRFIKQATKNPVSSTSPLKMECGSDQCRRIAEEVILDRNMKQNSKRLLLDNVLYQSRPLPVVPQNTSLSLSVVLQLKLSDSNTESSYTKKDDPRNGMNKFLQIHLKEKLFILQNLVELSPSDLAKSTHVNDVQDVVDSELDSIMELEGGPEAKKLLERKADNVIRIKSVSSLEIAKMAQVAELFLDFKEDDADEISSAIKDSQGRGLDVLIDDILNTRSPALSNTEAPTYRTYMAMDASLRLNLLRMIYGRRICKIIQIWKRPFKEFQMVLSMWSTVLDTTSWENEALLPKDSGSKTQAQTLIHEYRRGISICLPGTFLKSSTYSLPSKYSDAVHKTRDSSLVQMLEDFEDSIFNSSVLRPSTGSDARAVKDENERIARKKQEVQQRLKEEAATRKALNSSFLDRMTFRFSKLYENVRESLAKLYVNNDADMQEKELAKNKATTTSGTLPENTQIVLDDMDMLMDLSVVCGFFKGCVLLDHGYAKNELLLLDVCQNERESVNYLYSIWSEFTSDTASASIISPHKGNVERYFMEFRNPGDSVNNAIYNIRTMTNQWRVDVPGHIARIIQQDRAPRKRKPEKKRAATPGPVVNAQKAVRVAELLDTNNLGPSISQADYIFSKTREIYLSKALKWLKIDGTRRDVALRNALLLDVNEKYVNPYESPLNRLVGSGLPYFMVQKSPYDKHSHPAIINKFLEIESSFINDGLELFPTKQAIYMNPKFSFRAGGIVKEPQDTTLYTASGYAAIPEEKVKVTSEREPLEHLGCVLMARSLVHGNCVWLDATREYMDISNLLDPTNISDVNWFMDALFGSQNAFGYVHTKMWDSKDHQMFSDLVPSDILCAIHGNRIHIKRLPYNAPKTRSGDKLKEIMSMDEFISSDYFLCNYDVDAVVSQSPANSNAGMNMVSKSALDMSPNFLHQMTREFNLRKTYFDIACTNILPLLRYGAIKKPYTSKRVWDTVTARKGKKFGIWKLSENMDTHIRHFFNDFKNQSIASPQLFLLHGRKMAPWAKLANDSTSVDYFGSSVATYTTVPLVSAVRQRYEEATALLDPRNNNQPPRDVSPTSNIVVDSLDLRYLMDVSFLRRSKRYVASLEETYMNIIGSKELSSLEGDINTASYRDIAQKVKNKYVERLNILSKENTNIPNNNWNMDEFPTPYQVITNGPFHRQLLQIYDTRKVHIPIYSLDTGDNCNLLIPPAYNYTNVQGMYSNPKVGHNTKPELQNIEAIYKHLSWVSDVEKIDNVGVSIVAIMSYISCLWTICMTAKKEALQIYKPSDILKMTVGQWVIPHNAELSTGSVSGMVCCNKSVYDLYEKEFTGISDVVIGEITNSYDSTGRSALSTPETSSIQFKTTTPVLSQEGRRRLQEAFEYVSMIPDMYMKHVGHMMQTYEKLFTLNAADPVKARESQMRRFDVLNTSHSQNSENMLDAYRWFMKTMQEDQPNANDEYKALRMDYINHFAHYAELQRIKQEENNIMVLLTRQETALANESTLYEKAGDAGHSATAYEEKYKVNDDKLATLMDPTNPRRYVEPSYESSAVDERTGRASKILKRPQNINDIVRDQERERLMLEGIEQYKRRLRKLEVDMLLNAPDTEGFSVASILYASLNKGSHVDKHAALSPLQRDSFNIIYTLTKMLTSGGTQNSRVLDAGAGFSSRMFTSTDQDSYIQDLLNASISMNGLDLWTTLSPTMFEMGSLDSLISDE